MVSSYLHIMPCWWLMLLVFLFTCVVCSYMFDGPSHQFHSQCISLISHNVLLCKRHMLTHIISKAGFIFHALVYARIRQLSAQLYILLSLVEPSAYARIHRLSPIKFNHVELSRPTHIFLANQWWYTGSLYWTPMSWLTETSTRTRSPWPLLKRIIFFMWLHGNVIIGLFLK